MSWLNLNDSFNNLKGQISNFANNVLAEEDDTQKDARYQLELEELQRVCTLQQQEIKQLQQFNLELRGDRSASECDNGSSKQTEAWSWEISETPTAKAETQEIVDDLRRTIAELQSEKKELTSNLVLLDSEHQQNTEKLMKMKNSLQAEYNSLKEKYELSVKDKSNNASCPKCEKLADEMIVLNARPPDDDELLKMEEKLTLCQSENKILIAELKKGNESLAEYEKKSEIDAENCKKLAFILEGYEQQVSALKQELATTENLSELKVENQELQKQLGEAQQIHAKYINILKENIQRYIDCDESCENLDTQTDQNVSEFSNQVKSIINILVDLKSKCESLENELFSVTQDKTTLVSEKNHEIEKLIQNSEILSQEVIVKSRAIKDFESECNELIRNNDLLINEMNILKNSSGLHTISESNEDNILLLESQLENANTKIADLERLVSQQEDVSDTGYEKLMDDFSEVVKERSLLEEEKGTLTSTLEKMRNELENADYQYTEVKVNLETLKEEVEKQKKNLEQELQAKLSLEKNNLELERSNEDFRSELNVIREKFLVEEDCRKQCENQVRNLTEKLQNAKMTETSLKLQYDTLNKELIGITENKQTLEGSLKNALTNLDQCRNDNLDIREENKRLEILVDDLEGKLKEMEADVTNMKNETVSFQDVSLAENVQSANELVVENQTLMDEIKRLTLTEEEHFNCSQNIENLERKIVSLDDTNNELKNVIITKHQESVTYHNEIQKLTKILNTEVEKNRDLESQLQTLKTQIEQISTNSQKIEKLTDQNNFLKQKCEVLAQNLLEEQSKVQKMLAEQNQPSEKEQSLSKNIERLQVHLIEVEEHYTQELIKAEEKNEALQAKVNQIEQREKDSSTMYTSVSIRANQHVETLQSQLQLITNQRDDLRKKISDAEDHAGKQEAALTNLQFVLDQFQKDREKDVKAETERIRRQITAEKKLQSDLRNEISALTAQLEESRQGLLAASRLSDQLEQSKQQVTTLKKEASQLNEKLTKTDAHLQSLCTQSDGKVDKSLIKNLIVGFVSTNNNLSKDQNQILKIIATVLDFNQQDHDKVNLSKPHQGWLSSLTSPHASQEMSQESLSQAFVRFLEKESKPRLVPSLLSTSEEVPKSRKSSTSSRQSPTVLSEMVLPTFADFGQNRNSSSILKDVLKDNS